MGAPASAIAVGANTVWVATRDGLLAQVDPQTTTLVRTVRLGHSVAGLAIEHGRLWATSAPRATRQGARRGRARVGRAARARPRAALRAGCRSRASGRGKTARARSSANRAPGTADAFFRVTPCTRKIFSVVTTNRVRSQRQTAAKELTPAIPITSGPAIGNGHGIARKNSPAIASAIARRNGRTSTTL